MRSPLFIVRGARQLVTVRQAGGPRRGAEMQDAGVIAGGALLIGNGVVLQAGSAQRVENLVEARRAQELDATGGVVVPGLVDASADLSGRSSIADLALRLLMHGTTSVGWAPPERSSRPKRLIRQLTAAGVDVAAVAGTREPVLSPALPSPAEETIRWREKVDAGAAVAMATGAHAAGAAGSVLAALSLACLAYQLTPAEALCAATLNAAHAIGLGETLGSLEYGKQADVLILDVPDYREIPYQFGVNLVRTVIKRGHVVYRRGEIRCPKL